MAEIVKMFLEKKFINVSYHVEIVNGEIIGNGDIVFTEDNQPSCALTALPLEDNLSEVLGRIVHLKNYKKLLINRAYVGCIINKYADFYYFLSNDKFYEMRCVGLVPIRIKYIDTDLPNFTIELPNYFREYGINVGNEEFRTMILQNSMKRVNQPFN